MERVPPFAGVAAKLEGLDAKDLSPAHLVILAESAIQVDFDAVTSCMCVGDIIRTYIGLYGDVHTQRGTAVPRGTITYKTA